MEMARGVSSGTVRFFVVFLVLIVAFVLRLGAINHTVVDHPIRADARDYYLYAYNMKHNSIYSTEYVVDGSKPKADALRSPGYPLFLLSLWDDHLGFMVWRVTFAQALIDTATVFLVFLVALWGMSFWWSVLAAFLVAISPHLISATTYLLTETLFTFLMMLGVWLVLLSTKWKWMAPVAGVVIGLAALTRPTLQYFVLFIPLPLIRAYGWRRGSLLGGFIIFGFLLVLAPWVARNISVIGQPMDNRLAINTLHHGMYPNFTYKGRPETKGFPYRFDPRSEEIGKSYASVLAEIIKRFRQDPKDYLYWYFMGKPIYFFSWDIVAGMGDVFIYPVVKSPYFTSKVYIFTHRVMKSIHWPLVILAVLGSLMACFSRKVCDVLSSQGFLWVVLFFLLMYFVVLHIVGAPFPRYSIPVIPVTIILAILVLRWGVEKVYRIWW